MTTSGVLEWRSDVDSTGRLEPGLIERYRRDGFVRVRGVLDQAEAEHFRGAAERFLQAHRSESLAKDQVFTQLVNVWRQDPAMSELTLHPRLAGVAEQLAGIPLRIWHDHMLVKEPHNEAATEFHQDRPYWPHDGDRHSLSAWIALVDVPPERGCMTFLPGTQELTGFRPQNLRDEEDLFDLDPSLRWVPRVTVPLKAGDCTFHSSYTGHMATPNRTDLARLAHVAIYMDAGTKFSGAPHPVTEPLGLTAGQSLDGEMFPRPGA
ncbi:Ectoine hydroxylase-related dioxygenase, phytanoyl-CoA dioxygenase (PhyH) family [Actinopolymorpha cephalotaxi]|uniref:Ectoine hydroxylase-related dioxygenase (Phytanoyl-CoA dioxygenase family) n=1 Tax=Actinopolymorpha cephalotaxi TaxID=504797 RepID=A0A1I2NDD1_9ACTN|nr:phytanoyl-CoA dioxygenase family protein [Actinopolymorpha cephalotaxi]NYH85585.1 ectoine hydroxylase-related dioxygenase (phytanoyl-CoA dioxygenase family) [Actinopolymorpha cephalotaxi]SFG01593.1 Ectoine hydroxylase-related dioxygenase, phytanoyl-CoA dioxygenase (PhyH) family [Actinopolymorpha cephalotaxi]